MSTQSGPFDEILSEARRILTLGQALSPTQPATLALRTDAGFLIGEVRATGDAGPSVVAEADLDGHVGNVVPTALSPDATAIHAALFAVRPDAAAAILIRSPRLAAWGLSRRPLPVRYFQMFGYTRADEVAIADPSPATVRERLLTAPETPALLLTDGRVLIWAGNAQRAVRLVLSLEEAAHVTALADHIGGARDYPAEARDKTYESLRAQVRR